MLIGGDRVATTGPWHATSDGQPPSTPSASAHRSCNSVPSALPVGPAEATTFAVRLRRGHPPQGFEHADYLAASAAERPSMARGPRDRMVHRLKLLRDRGRVARIAGKVTVANHGCSPVGGDAPYRVRRRRRPARGRHALTPAIGSASRFTRRVSERRKLRLENGSRPRRRVIYDRTASTSHRRSAAAACAPVGAGRAASRAFARLWKEASSPSRRTLPCWTSRESSSRSSRDACVARGKRASARIRSTHPSLVLSERPRLGYGTLVTTRRQQRVGPWEAAGFPEPI